LQVRLLPVALSAVASNADIANAFDEMAALLEITGGNAFKVNAYRRASRTCADAADDLCLLAQRAPAKLGSIEGIGSGLASKIAEFAASGTIADLAALRASVPPGLPELLQLQGVGPKTVRQLWKEAGVDSVAALKSAIGKGALAGLARIGTPKSIANITEAIEHHLSRAGAPARYRIGQALPVGEGIAALLRGVNGVARVEIAGSARRGRDTVGDLDILVGMSGVDAAERVSECAVSMEGVGKVLGRGPTKVSLRLSHGMQVDVRMVPMAAFGAALLYFTGSKEHNVQLRERAIARRMHLNEYGLFPDDGQPAPQDRGVAPLAADDEESIYGALGMPHIPPECREAHGELEWTEVPPLVELGDIRSELHAHTTASDGELSIVELAELAKSRGFHTIAVTDHSKASAQANGLSVDRLMRHIDAVREAEQSVGGIRILAGSEVDILADGRLDYDDDTLSRLDIVVASPHTALRQEPAAATARLLSAIRHPLVHIIGHPTGRIVLGRDGLSPDIRAVAAAAAEHGVALEINAHWMRLDLRDAHVRAAMEAGAMIAIDCDIHAAADADNLRYGVMTARRGGVTRDRCVNCLDADALAAWLARRR
jgi:DNA polymerase (family 10)